MVFSVMLSNAKHLKYKLRDIISFRQKNQIMYSSLSFGGQTKTAPLCPYVLLSNKITTL